MFERPFSFEGRIRRTEFGLSMLIYAAVWITMNLLLVSLGTAGIAVMFIIIIPLLWFVWAQAAKRCHDRGNSGWYQLIPFYGFVLLFGDGEYGPNEYGPNPKGLGNEEVPQPSDDLIVGNRNL